MEESLEHLQVSSFLSIEASQSTTRVDLKLEEIFHTGPVYRIAAEHACAYENSISTALDSFYA